MGNKNGAETEMSYCPFEHNARCTGEALGRRGVGTLGHWASEVQARGTEGAGTRHEGCRRAGWRAAQRKRARASLRHGSLALLHGRLGGNDTATARTWACLRALGRAGWAVCVHTVHLTSF